MNIRLRIYQAFMAIMIAINALSLGAEEMDTTHLGNLRPFDYEILVLKDGTRLYGFTGSQSTDGSIKFNTLISTRSSHRKGIENQIKYTSREQLPGHIRKKLKKYEPFVKTLGLKETLRLAKYPRYSKLFDSDTANDPIEISVEGLPSMRDPGTMEDIIVLEESLDSIRFISFTPTIDDIKYAEIDERISFDLPNNLGYGLRDRVTTDDEKVYLGRITRRRHGRNIVISSEGTDKTIPMDKVTMTEMMGADPAKPIMAQTPFITRIYFKDGKSITGTIILMNYDTGDMHIVTNLRNDTIHRKISDLERRVYEINPDYPPKKTVKLDYTASKIYADTILLTPLTVELSKTGHIDMKNTDMEKEATAIRLSGDSITISMDISNESAITLTRLSNDSNQDNVSLSQQLVKGAAPNTRKPMPALDATLCTFNGVTKGYYLLSLLKNDMFYLIWLE